VRGSASSRGRDAAFLANAGINDRACARRGIVTLARRDVPRKLLIIKLCNPDRAAGSSGINNESISQFLARFAGTNSLRIRIRSNSDRMMYIQTGQEHSEANPKHRAPFRNVNQPSRVRHQESVDVPDLIISEMRTNTGCIDITVDAHRPAFTG
jgi:hypothetical protein